LQASQQEAAKHEFLISGRDHDDCGQHQPRELIASKVFHEFVAAVIFDAEHRHQSRIPERQSYRCADTLKHLPEARRDQTQKAPWRWLTSRAPFQRPSYRGDQQDEEDQGLFEQVELGRNRHTACRGRQRWSYHCDCQHGKDQ